MSPLTRFRVALAIFMAGLVLSGVTAFPLLAELRMVTPIVGAEHACAGGLQCWLATVHNGLEQTYARYPWVAYGTDWLGFGHLVIALFFIGPFLQPVANRWVLIVGVVACAGVIPLALICGAIRNIPFAWQLIDCSFGVFGIIPLVYCLRLLPRIASGQK